MRWLWPEPDAYIRYFPRLVRGFGGRAFENGTAHATEDFLRRHPLAAAGRGSR